MNWMGFVLTESFIRRGNFNSLLLNFSYSYESCQCYCEDWEESDKICEIKDI